MKHNIFDEKTIYSDKKLLIGVQRSKKEVKAGKGKVLKSNQEIDEYFKRL